MGTLRFYSRVSLLTTYLLIRRFCNIFVSEILQKNLKLTIMLAKILRILTCFFIFIHIFWCKNTYVFCDKYSRIKNFYLTCKNKKKASTVFLYSSVGVSLYLMGRAKSLA